MRSDLFCNEDTVLRGWNINSINDLSNLCYFNSCAQDLIEEKPEGCWGRLSVEADVDHSVATQRTSPNLSENAGCYV